MNIFRLLKIFKKEEKRKEEEKAFSLIINNNLIEKTKVFYDKSHHKTYQILRTFKTPQYDAIYLLGNKKAFNTFGFNINYDIVICDRNGRVIEMYGDVAPGFISPHKKESHFIYFMTTGSLNFYKLKKFDRIRKSSDWTKW